MHAMKETREEQKDRSSKIQTRLNPNFADFSAETGRIAKLGPSLPSNFETPGPTHITESK
jgi:hypothetical protein